MASKLAEAYVEIGANRGKLTSELGKARQEVNTFATGVTSRLGEMAKAGLGFVTAAFGVSEMYKTAAEAEKVNARLRTTLRVTRNNAKENYDEMSDAADAFKDALGIDDDEIKHAMTSALTMGVPAKNMDEFMRLAIGLSRVTGGDLNEGVTLATKALSGNTEALARSIPSIKRYGTEQERLNEVVRVANVGFQQQIELADTTAGRIDRLSNAWSDFQKSAAGQAAVGRPLEGMTSILKMLSGSDAEIMKTGGSIGKTLFAGLAPVLGERGKMFSDFFGMVAEAGVKKELDAVNKIANQSGKGVSDGLKKAMQGANDEASKTLRIFEKLEDIYKDAQEESAKGGGFGAAAAGGAGSAGAASAVQPGTADASNPLDTNARGGRGKLGPTTTSYLETEQTKLYALYDKEQQMKDQGLENTRGFAALEAQIKKQEDFMRPLYADPYARTPNADQAEGQTLSEMLSGTKPLKVEDTKADELIRTLQTLNGILPNLKAVMGH